jgi:hypothetical protein
MQNLAAWQRPMKGIFGMTAETDLETDLESCRMAAVCYN